MVPKLSIVCLLCSSLVVNLLQPSQAELFTAIAEVKHLLETHKRIIDDLDDYINSEEHRLVSLKKHLNIYKREHEKAMEDIPNYLGNPINAFTLIKRLTTDLDVIEQSIKIGTEYTKNITINHDDVKYPGMEDLTGAAQALTRLQETYRLDIHELSEGLLNGVVYSTPMSASDCYELGRALYNAKDYRHALAWMTEALRKYEDDETYTFSDTDILEYISFSHYLLGDVKSALEWTKKLLLVDPEHVRARGNVPHYQKSIDEQEAIKKKRMRGETGEETEQEEPAISEELAAFRRERKSYEMLCRGEMEISAEVAKRLYCRYLTENHPFLKLAPVKMEYMYLNPDVIVFYDVMSDDEIKYIQEKAKPRFKRAVVHDPKTGEIVTAHYRISKSAWLRDDESRVVARVSRRVADLTRLNMLSAEELQVVNYGIGGHYEPHYDFARRQDNAFKKFGGNRIATVLFYMSDVAQGGATVFTQLGLSVFPIRGAALYWLNLHASGEGDLDTRHAACPVLRGDKWVCNKWLHQGGQELILPCNLEYQDESMVRSIPQPVLKTYR